MSGKAATRPEGQRLSTSKTSALRKRIWNDRYLLMLFLPVLVFYILFCYVPMWGILVAFKDFKPFLGFFKSKWVGFENFEMFFSSPDALRTIKNSLVLGIYSLVWTFPIPIIFALLLNELTRARFKSLVQTVSYMPHFFSAVVVCGLLVNFLDPVNGIINVLLEKVGIDSIYFIGQTSWFRTIYIASDIWQYTGWSAIVYLAAISSVSPEMYEAAKLDGASRWRMIWSITLPSIAPTIVVMLILRVGSILGGDMEKTLLLQSPLTYEVSDVISTYVYRQLTKYSNFSYGTAVGLFNSVVNMVLLLTANYFSKKYTDAGLY